MKEQRIYNINQYKTYRCGVTGQPVTAAIVVARFHRPPFLIRAVSILFTFAEKVCALSWFTQERKEFYFYMTHFCRDERTQITQITKSLAFFGVLLLLVSFFDRFLKNGQMLQKCKKHRNVRIRGPKSQKLFGKFSDF